VPYKSTFNNNEMHKIQANLLSQKILEKTVSVEQDLGYKLKIFKKKKKKKATHVYCST
jgi:hypothetical protein